MVTVVARVGDAAIEKGGAAYSVVVDVRTVGIEVRQGDERIVVIVVVVDGPTSAGLGEGSCRMKVEGLVGRRGREWRSVGGGSDLDGLMMACCF